MFEEFDNSDICALATPQGTSAIAVIRTTGPECLSKLDRIFVSKGQTGALASTLGYRMRFGLIMDADEVVDEVLVAIFRAPHSYTGEESAEIYCHGSNYVIGKIMETLLSNGFRMAQPGEFSKRAFLNGKMDLAQTEAVADLISSETAAAHNLAIKQMRGGFSNELKEMRQEMLNLLSLMELELDFSEEEVEFADRARLRELLDSATQRCRSLCNSFRAGNAIRNGVPVAIAGAPNSGKSTLLNALLHDDRAIVSPIPGTTRDTIEEGCVLGGILMRFIDTAGLRESDDCIERMGIERSRAKIREAFVVLGVLDAALDPDELLAQACELASCMSSEDQKLVLLLNKLDIADNPHANKNVMRANIFVSLLADKGIDANVLEISAKTGLGLEKLLDTLASSCSPDSGSDLLVTNARHAEALRASAEALDKVASGLELQLPTDLLAEDLRDAISHLGTITGEISTDEVLGEIFGRFCIGK